MKPEQYKYIVFLHFLPKKTPYFLFKLYIIFDYFVNILLFLYNFFKTYLQNLHLTPACDTKFAAANRAAANLGEVLRGNERSD